MVFCLGTYYDNVLLELGQLPCVLPLAVHLDLGHLPDTQGYTPFFDFDFGLGLGFGLVNITFRTILRMTFRMTLKMTFKIWDFSFLSLTFVDVKLVKDSSRFIVDRDKQSEILESIHFNVVFRHNAPDPQAAQPQPMRCLSALDQS